MILVSLKVRRVRIQRRTWLYWPPLHRQSSIISPKTIKNGWKWRAAVPFSLRSSMSSVHLFRWRKRSLHRSRVSISERFFRRPLNIDRRTRRTFLSITSIFVHQLYRTSKQTRVGGIRFTQPENLKGGGVCMRQNYPPTATPLPKRRRTALSVFQIGGEDRSPPTTRKPARTRWRPTFARSPRRRRRRRRRPCPQCRAVVFSTSRNRKPPTFRSWK